MTIGFWHSLPTLVALAAVLADWRLWMGEDFAWARHYLRPTGKLTADYPCTGKPDCGCRHEFDGVEGNHYRWVCCCGIGDCPAVTVGPEEVRTYELDVKRLVGALCGGLKLSPARNGVGRYLAEHIRPVGTYGARESPVYLALCANERDLLASLRQLASWGSEPFIVLAPTARVRSKAVELFLEEERSVFIPLAPCVAVDGAGVFRMTNRIDKVLTQFEMGLGNGSEVKPATRKSFGSCGRLRYENDFSDTWLGDEHFDLRKYGKARLCLEYLVENGAYSVKSARHFLEEIDPYVRQKGGFIELKEIRMQDYFREPSGRLAKLRQRLVRSAGKNGKYYLMTGVG